MQNDRTKIGSNPAITVPETVTGQGTLLPVGLGTVFGYARVSRSDSQDYGHQISSLRLAGATTIFTDEISGGVPTGARPGFRDAVSHLRPGDVLLAAEMSRISRSLTDLIATIEMLTAQGVTVRVLGLGDLDSTSATGRLMIGLLGLVAEFERSLIRARTISGIANARRSGVRIGRPPALDAQGTRALIAMKSAGASVPEVCVALSISERTVRRTLAAHLPQPCIDAARGGILTYEIDDPRFQELNPGEGRTPTPAELKPELHNDDKPDVSRSRRSRLASEA